MNSLPEQSVITIKSNFETLMQDCISQINSLNNRNDLDWDCYDRSNWENTIHILENTMDLLGININKQYLVTCNQLVEDEELSLNDLDKADEYTFSAPTTENALAQFIKMARIENEHHFNIRVETIGVDNA